MSQQRVAKWCAEFRTGRVTTSDVARSGRLTTTGTAENKPHIELAILENREVTVNDLTHGLSLEQCPELFCN